MFGNYNLQNIFSEKDLQGHFVQRCSFLTWLALKAAAKLFGTVTAISLDVSALGSVIQKAKVEADGGKIHSDCY